MAEKKTDEQAGTYRLKDTDTMFYDDETGLEVTRDQVVKIDAAKIGRRTARMIAKGGLIEVNTAPKPPEGFDPNAGEAASAIGTAGGSAAGDDLPDDFPGAKLLRENGITTYAQFDAATNEQIEGIKGIGDRTLEEGRAASKKRTK